MYDLCKLKARIKTLCSKYGISQKFVSESTGHGQYFLNDVWQGKRAMSDTDYMAIAGVLHTTPEYLKCETDDPNIKDDITKSIMEVVRLVAENNIGTDSRREKMVRRIMSMDEKTLEKLEKILDMILEEK